VAAISAAILLMEKSKCLSWEASIIFKGAETHLGKAVMVSL